MLPLHEEPAVSPVTDLLAERISLSCVRRVAVGVEVQLLLEHEDWQVEFARLQVLEMRDRAPFAAVGSGLRDPSVARTQDEHHHVARLKLALDPLPRPGP